MYIVTDLPAIAAAIGSKAPRPIIDVIREFYPDATVDCNGRGHAPYDGYVCLHTDKSFRAGEYLPDPETEEALFARRPGASRMMNVVCEGAVHVFEGTKAQLAAGREVAKAQQLAFDKTRSFVGTEGGRANFDFTVFAVFEDFGAYGVTYTHMMRDADFNPVIYKGSKLLGKAGENIKAKFTVKSHWATPDKSRKATYVARPAVA